VDDDRLPVNLDFIDFVRVYTGLNQKCPAPNWWGETSTEIISAEDIHLESSLNAIHQATGMSDLESGDRSQETGVVFDLQGHRIPTDSRLPTPDSFLKGLYIKNGKKIIIK
jgi:hypothetical protein